MAPFTADKTGIARRGMETASAGIIGTALMASALVAIQGDSSPSSPSVVTSSSGGEAVSTEIVTMPTMDTSTIGAVVVASARVAAGWDRVVIWIGEATATVGVISEGEATTGAEGRGTAALPWQECIEGTCRKETPERIEAEGRRRKPWQGDRYDDGQVFTCHCVGPSSQARLTTGRCFDCHVMGLDLGSNWSIHFSVVCRHYFFFANSTVLA
jgi:hypothetical protein